MEKKNLVFDCIHCKNPITFNLFELAKESAFLHCPDCDRIYDFSDATLQSQLQKFHVLCTVLRDSEEILNEAMIGVDVGPHQVKIPFCLLLTRLGVTIDLILGDEPHAISFRFEPAHKLQLR